MAAVSRACYRIHDFCALSRGTPTTPETSQTHQGERAELTSKATKQQPNSIHVCPDNGAKKAAVTPIRIMHPHRLDRSLSRPNQNNKNKRQIQSPSINQSINQSTIPHDQPTNRTITKPTINHSFSRFSLFRFTWSHFVSSLMHSNVNTHATVLFQLPNEHPCSNHSHLLPSRSNDQHHSLRHQELGYRTTTRRASKEHSP